MRVSHLRLAVILLAWSASTSAQTAPPASSTPEPEEPDFAFVTGGPFTQLKNSIQLIHQFGYGTRRFPVSGGQRYEDEFLFFLRTEWGLTDRLELDVITPGAGARERFNGATASSAYAFADSTLGLRYRLLREEDSPITLTMGPQVILPTGSFRRGTGNDSAGFAWDVAAAKDWGGPVFMFWSLNYGVLPAAKDPTPGSTRKFALHHTTWASALAFRPLERETATGANHDIHVFLEAGGSYGHTIEPGATAGARRGELSWVFAPGVRYGFLTAGKTLIEIGISAPIGLGPHGPKRSFILQFQFEKVFGKK
jgi:hypothetical protein